MMPVAATPTSSVDTMILQSQSRRANRPEPLATTMPGSSSVRRARVKFQVALEGTAGPVMDRGGCRAERSADSRAHAGTRREVACTLFPLSHLPSA